MGHLSNLENPAVRQGLWEAVFKSGEPSESAEEIPVIIEPATGVKARDCFEQIRSIAKVAIRLRGIAEPFVLAALTQDPSSAVSNGVWKEQEIVKRLWYDAPLEPQTSVSTVTIGAADATDRTWGADFGAGITWAMIDTGVRADHDHFRNISVTQFEVDSSGTIPEPSDFSGWANLKEGQPTDPHGHGTHVAGILTGSEPHGSRRGVAPRTDIISFRLSGGPNRAGRDGDLIAILKFLTEAKRSPQLSLLPTLPLGVNISLAISPRFQDDAVGESPSCQSVDAAVAEGLVIVTAAGNRGAIRAPAAAGGVEFKEVSFTDPANAYGTIVVTACHKEDPGRKGIWSKSSRGPTADGRLKPDLAAPGVAISSADAWGKSRYTEMDGTSQAAPHVSGAIAALMSEVPETQSLLPSEILDLLKNSATDLNRDSSYQGAGMLDLKASLSAARQRFAGGEA